MTKEKAEYRNISLKASLVNEIEEFIDMENSRYRSLAEFVAESARLRLELLKKEA